MGGFAGLSKQETADRANVRSIGVIRPTSVVPVVRSIRVGRGPKTLVMGADLMAIMVAMVAAYRFRTIIPGSLAAFAPRRHMYLGLASLPIWSAVCAHYGLYSGRRVSSRLEEFRSIVHAALGSVLGIIVLTFALKLDVSRGWTLTLLPASIVLLSAEREIVRRIFAMLRRRGRLLRRVLIAGSNEEAIALCSMLQDDARLGYDVIGFLADDIPIGEIVHDGIRVIGTVENAVAATVTEDITGVIVATTAVDTDTTNRLARHLSEVGLHVEISASLCDVAAERLKVRPLGRYPVLYVESARLQGWRRVAKRTFDLCVAVPLLVITSPFLLLAAVIIKLETPGPVFFRQSRVGCDNAPFIMLKLRTMVRNAQELQDSLVPRNEAAYPLFKMRNDPRVTRFGRVLRRMSLDELPQLFNVISGQMSMVGPRPALPHEVSAWSEDLKKRLRLKPGLTGLWQVSGRSDASFEDYVRWDLYYLDNWSLWADVSIVLRTIPAVFRSHGAY